MIELLHPIRLLYLAFVKIPLRILRWGDEAAVMSLEQDRELVEKVREE